MSKHVLIMKFKIVLFFLLNVALTGLVSAQEIDLYMISIKARVTGADTGDPIPYAHVIYPNVHGGTTTDIDGYFSISMLNEDTLIIRSIGYVDYRFTAREYPLKPLYEIRLQPTRYLLKEVTVTDENGLKKKLGLPESKSIDVPIELRGDAFNEKPNFLQSILSPASFLQYHLDQGEKEKRKTRMAILDEKQWLQFSTYHNLDNIIKITGLHGNEADDFMIYCNINNRLPYFASQMEIEFQIMDFFFKYKKEKEESGKVVGDSVKKE